MPSTRLTVIALALSLFVLCALNLVAQAGGPRYALVIGNGNYADLGKLKNPPNDAADMAQALGALGFKVKLLVDADLPSMEDAVLRLGNDLSQSADSMGFFFYAGHGVQSDGANYLIPTDAHIISEPYLRTKALPAQVVFDTLQGSRNALNIVVLDACRDNPFAWGRSAVRGLTVVGSQPPGSIIAYATSAGSVAEDGTGRNGIFTTELLKQIRTPGLEIKDVFNRTGKAVSTVTAGKQVPVVYNQFFDSAYLAGGQNAVAVTVPSAPMPTLTVTRSYGGVLVSAATAGTLYLDGKSIGDLPAGAKAKLDSVEVGDRSLELRYADGQVERKSATVKEGQAASLSFTYKALPPGARPASNDDLVFVKGGSFMMGSGEGKSNEGPMHAVTVSDFFMSKYLVTQELYYNLIGKNPSKFNSQQARVGGLYALAGGPKYPVEQVTWNEAVIFCNKLSERDGLQKVYTRIGATVSCDWAANGYRLPTEAEWEYAAKGGQSGLVRAPDFAGSDNADQVAWYYQNSNEQTHPVGQKAPNALGLYDMSGNVKEWCWDWYGSYSSEQQTDPKGPTSGGHHVLRGGSWATDVANVRLATRSFVFEGQQSDIGFRIARRP